MRLVCKKELILFRQEMTSRVRKWNQLLSMEKLLLQITQAQYNNNAEFIYNVNISYYTILQHTLTIKEEKLKKPSVNRDD